MARGRPPAPRILPPEQSGIPAKPATIAKDPVADGLWEDLTSMLLPMGVLSPADGPILTALCSAYGMLVKAREVIEAEGYISTNKSSGVVKVHPAVNLAAGAARDVRTFASELGLSPTARARILHLHEDEEVESMDDFDREED